MEHKISIKTVLGTVLPLDEFKNNGFALKDAIGVVLQTPVIGMIISLERWKEIWGQHGELITSEKGRSRNLMDLSGLDLTRQIIDFQNKSNFDQMTAAKRCWEHHAGGLQWYLPSVYELCTICAFWSEIRDTMISIGNDEDDIPKNYNPEEGCFWSSSESTCYHSVLAHLYTGHICETSKVNAFLVRAVSAFSRLYSFDLSSASDTLLFAEMRKRGFAGKINKTFEL